MDKINYNTLFEPLIHFEPLIYQDIAQLTNEKFPLYGLSSDTDDGGTGLYKSETSNLINRSQAWREATQTTYSSPTNIKRIILSPTKVEIDFHKPPMINGKPASFGKKYIGTTTKLVEDKLGRRESLGAIIVNFFKNPGQEYSISSSPLRLLSTPWVLSNIEEVILDFHLLLTSDTINNLKGSVSSKYIRQMIFKWINVNSMEELEKKFPRLRSIMIIKGVADAIDKKVIKDVQIEELCYDGLKKANLLGSITYHIDTSNVEKYKTKWPSIRNYYKFDKEILSAYRIELMKEFDRASYDTLNELNDDSLGQGSETSEEAINYINSELINLLDELKSEHGINYVSHILNTLSFITKFGTNESKSINLEQLLRNSEYAPYI